MTYRKNIALIGDFIIDMEISSTFSEKEHDETDVYKVSEVNTRLGGAGKVCELFSNLQTKLNLIPISVVDNANYQEVIKQLINLKISHQSIILEELWLTPIKNRIYSNKKHIPFCRFDYEETNRIQNDIFTKVKNEIDKLCPTTTCFIVVDYGKGMIDDRIYDYLLEKKRTNCFDLIVDTKVRRDFCNCNIIKMNYREYLTNWHIGNDSKDEILSSIRKIKHELNIQNFIITHDQNGVILVDIDGNLSKFDVPQVINPNCIGAGDYFTSYLCLQLYGESKSIHDAVYLSSQSATKYVENQKTVGMIDYD